MDCSKILEGFKKYPKTQEFFEYGTAGFRAKTKKLNHVAFRTGMLAGLRAKDTQKTVGLMITASHNPADDNGVKVIDPKGDMLEFVWEEIATKIVNSQNNDIEKLVNTVINSRKIDLKATGRVIIGWDTRASSEILASISSEGIASVEAIPEKIDLCTTPMLHFLVRCRNDKTYGIATPNGYYDKLLTGFEHLWDSINTNDNGNYIAEVNFDGANGVGAVAMGYANDCLKLKIKVNFYNDSIKDTSKLNFECGADYAKQLKKIPAGLPDKVNCRSVSFDGDADRIIYYYLDDNKKFHILDGDRMSVLLATFLKELVSDAKLQPTPSIGIVQTAYANGNSTRFIEEKLKIQPIFTKTGVKHLVQEALKYDIGIYFEANGHGTVLFSDKFKAQIEEKLHANGSEKNIQFQNLKSCITMINECIGDAFSDFLTIESILHIKGWSLKDWEKLYTDLPSKLLKVSVKDRNVITTTDAERKVVTPNKLQERIDNIVTRYKSGRSFVRPSGTENIVRIYAEAETQEDADNLASEVSKLVYDMAGGIGKR